MRSRHIGKRLTVEDLQGRWIDILRGGRPMRLETAETQRDAFIKAVGKFIRANGGIADGAVKPKTPISKSSSAT